MSTERLAQYLAHPRFEVLPLRGVADEVSALPEGSTVTVTSSPAKGIEATLDVAARLRGRGYVVVPHLAARSVRDAQHLADTLAVIAELGISEVFVVAGDSPEPVGKFADALDLLRAMDDVEHRPARIGITGYPEGHAFISDACTILAMEHKARHADYIVSQICYDPDTIASWIAGVRARGVTLPIYVGVPGVVDIHRLLRISLKIGLGSSIRFIRKQHGVMTKLLSRYTPEDIFTFLTPYLSDPAYDIAGWHFFTFNEAAKTYLWTQDIAARIQEVPA